MTRILFIILFPLFLMTTNSSNHAGNPPFAADLIIVNANIHTMNPTQPSAEAVAIQGNRIVAVGSSQEIKKLGGSNTRVIDAHAQLMLPGFNDAHVHFMSGGFQLSSVDLHSFPTRRRNSPIVSVA